MAAFTVVAAAPVSSAHAKSCSPSTLSQPFAPWLDYASYELAPGGDFETSTWTLSDGAQIVSGSEPFASTGTLGSWSLSLPAGAVAKSPNVCVAADYPSVRFFITGSGTVSVGVIYDGTEIPTGVALGPGDWAPSLPMVTTAPIDALVNGGTAEVKLKFKALTGDPVVDDVWVDPWNRG